MSKSGKMVIVNNVRFSARTQIWCAVVVTMVAAVVQVAALNGANVCMVKQKYNITKRVKYTAPMSVRTYEWCLSIPPRCSKWKTEMRDLTRLETEERTAEVAVCCPGYKMRDVSCVPICPSGKTGQGCSHDCPQNKWGPNCVHECPPCGETGSCSPVTGQCQCHDGWQGESCESRMSTTTSTTTTTARVEELLTTIATKPTPPSTTLASTASTTAFVETPSASNNTLLPPTDKEHSRPTSSTSRDAQSTVSEKASTGVIPEETETKTLNPFIKTLKNNPMPVLNTLQNVPSSNKSISVISKPTIITTTASPVMTAPTPIFFGTSTSKTTVSTVWALEHTTSTQQPEVVENVAEIRSTTEKIAETDTIDVKSKVEHKNNSVSKIINHATTINKLEAYNNMTLAMPSTTEAYEPYKKVNTTSIYNRTESPHDTTKYVNQIHVEIRTTPVKIIKSSETTGTTSQQKTTNMNQIPVMTLSPNPVTEVNKVETTRRPDATIRYFPTTVKFKPKEIWIRPAQKGESFDAKKANDLKNKAINREPAQTTPKTIIVSIIPTSVSYSTYKKIALTTSSLLSQTTNMTLKSQNRSEQVVTKPMPVTTVSPFTLKFSTKNPETKIRYSTNSSKSDAHIYKATKNLSSLSSFGTIWKNKTLSNGTNSMTVAPNSSNKKPTVSISPTHEPIIITKVTKQIEVTPFEHVTSKPDLLKIKSKTQVKEEKTNATKTVKPNVKTNIVSTQSPEDEETFHILTEPEHITAVMEGKGNEKGSVDLISVVSIAGGIMMAVITVAVVIVMIERCRRPRFDDVRKMNDIHMQVMIDNSEVPPPYVRSIFHTPLPEPPTADNKCHYQPISTLDRNLKQFMRPVVVQTISPIMLENFRGILECHYDHLPRRSHDFEPKQRFSIAPSMSDIDELSPLRPCSIAESTIEALKCEAKMDILDSTTSEPLYAEIPCWRPPSEHAIEVMNINGEAVTEL